MTLQGCSWEMLVPATTNGSLGGGPAGLATGCVIFPLLLANLRGSSEPSTQKPCGPTALETYKDNASSFLTDGRERVAGQAGGRWACFLLP